MQVFPPNFPSVTWSDSLFLSCVQVGRFRTEVETAEAMDTSHSSSGPDGAASGNRDGDWQTEAEAEDTRDDDLREFYQAALEGSKYDSAELQDVHLFASKAQGTLDPRSVSALPSWLAPLPLSSPPGSVTSFPLSTPLFSLSSCLLSFLSLLSLCIFHITQVSEVEGNNERDETFGGITTHPP